jgi:predicted exporter
VSKTNRDILYLGVRYLGITVLLMFVAPISLYEAFKNSTHPLYIPVLIFGILCAVAAIAMAFLSVKTIVDAFFNKE